MLTFLTRYRADFALCFCGGGGGGGGGIALLNFVL